MASGKTLNAANLEALGAARLAALLIQISSGDAAIKRRLRLTLAGSVGPTEAIREVTKRLASIARARSFLETHAIKSLAAELDEQRRVILDLVAPNASVDAFDLMWRLVDCSSAVFARCGDGNARLYSVFQNVIQDLGPLAQAAKVDPADLARRAFGALQADEYNTWEELIPALAPQLGPAGLRSLGKMVEAWQGEAAVVPPTRERIVVGVGTGGVLYADQLATSHRRSSSAFFLKQIADALGDLDGYIAQFDARARAVPRVAAGIARRLLQAGRPQEAWDALERVGADHRDRGPLEWEQARAEALEALKRPEEAQAFRWQRFLATLEPAHLRTHLGNLPDFEDVEAEQRALDHALTFKDVHAALAFLVQWPDLRRASQLVLDRAGELNGDFYDFLSPAADALGEKYPLASTRLRRAMIGFALDGARSSRYKHAARHLHECAVMARRLAAFGDAPDHATYERALRAAHGRKTAFWQEVQAFG